MPKSHWSHCVTAKLSRRIQTLNGANTSTYLALSVELLVYH